MVAPSGFAGEYWTCVQSLTRSAAPVPFSNPKKAYMQPIQSETLLRLPGVLQRVPVSRSAWWAGVKTGRFPQPVKLGPRTTCWRSADIDKLIADLAAK